MARELLGVEPAEMVGCDWAELVPAEDENPFREGAERSVKHRLLRPYGPPLVAETSVSLRGRQRPAALSHSRPGRRVAGSCRTRSATG